jgi:hypothetical protein
MQSTCMMAVTLADQEARQAVGTTAEASATAAHSMQRPQLLQQQHSTRLAQLEQLVLQSQ